MHTLPVASTNSGPSIRAHVVMSSTPNIEGKVAGRELHKVTPILMIFGRRELMFKGFNHLLRTVTVARLHEMIPVMSVNIVYRISGGRKLRQ